MKHAGLFTTPLVSLAFLVSSIGCSATVDGSTSERADNIINGVASTVDEDAAVWVGILTADGNIEGSCSGVLVAENLLLTARHCVSRTSNGGISCSRTGSPIAGGAVYGDHDADQLAIIIGTKMTNRASARGTKLFTTGAKNLCNNDIALVLLDRKVAGAKIAPLRLDAPPAKGEKITAVGWGVSNTRRSRGNNVRLKRAEIAITLVGGGSGAGPSEFTIGEGICSGDSGGPAFAASGAVLGVVSRGGNGAPYDPSKDPAYTQCLDTADYTTQNIYSRVDAHRDLILKAFEEAGAEPWLEGGPDPRKAKLGELCVSADTCRSALCVDVDKVGDKAPAKVCSSTCSDASPCPDGFVCSASSSGSICLAIPTSPEPIVDPAADPGLSPPTSATGGGCSTAPTSSNGTPVFAGLGLFVALAIGSHSRRKRSDTTS